MIIRVGGKHGQAVKQTEAQSNTDVPIVRRALTDAFGVLWYAHAPPLILSRKSTHHECERDASFPFVIR
jgi:hypothetical protein